MRQRGGAAQKFLSLHQLTVLPACFQAAPPKKKKVARPVNAGADTYGGAGTFEPIDGLDVPDVPPKASGHAPIPSSMRPSNGAKLGHQSRTSEASLATMPSSKSHSQLPSSGSALTITDIPSSLRPSTSLANIDAYTPPYAPSTLGRSQSPAPPVAAAPASSSEYDDGGRDFMPPMPSSLYGHGSQLSHASLASHHSVNDLASLASGRTRMHGMSSSVSYGNLPISSTIAQPPAQYNDPADELLRPMSSMSFSSRPSQVDKPLPPTTAVPQDPAPTLAPHQSYPYQHSYQASASSAPPYGGIQGQYALPAGQPPPPQHSSSYSHSYQHVAPTPPPFPASAPPGQYQNESGTPGRHSYAGPPPDLQPPLGHYDAHELARPASPAARPHSAASYHLSSSVLSGPTPSVINAQ